MSFQGMISSDYGSRDMVRAKKENGMHHTSVLTEIVQSATNALKPSSRKELSLAIVGGIA